MAVIEEIHFDMGIYEFLRLNHVSWAAKGYFMYLQTLSDFEFQVEMNLIQLSLQKNGTSPHAQEFNELIHMGFLKIGSEK